MSEPISPQEQALIDASAALKVQSEMNTRVLTATFDSTDPKLSADFANALNAV